MNKHIKNGSVALFSKKQLETQKHSEGSVMCYFINDISLGQK